MRRGELWTVSGGSDPTGKPRPSLIVHDERYVSGGVVTICPLTSVLADAPLLRIVIQPDAENGLRRPSAVQVNRVSTVVDTKVGQRIGRLDDDSMRQVSLALATYMGLLA